MCAQISNYKIISYNANQKNISYYIKKNLYLSSVLHEKLITAKNTFQVLYNIVIPVLSCENETSIFHITYNNSDELGYIFGKFFNDASRKLTLAVYKPYLKIRNPRKQFADLFAIPSGKYILCKIT